MGTVPFPKSLTQVPQMVQNILKGIVAAVVVFTMVYLLSNLAPKKPKAPEVALGNYSQVADFDLINQNGEPVTKADVDGKVWLANFIFTSCATECPTLSMRVSAIQKRLQESGDDVKFISFSVDPQTDTPERLASYAKTFGARPGWEFLTGDPDELDKVIKESFLLPLAETAEEKAQVSNTQFIHTNRFAVVDQQGVVRYYQDGMQPKSIERTIEAIRLVQKEG